jgi:hypothetical protein
VVLLVWMSLWFLNWKNWNIRKNNTSSIN